MAPEAMSRRTDHRGAFTITASDRRRAAACARGCTLAEATATGVACMRSPVWWMRARARAAARRDRRHSDQFLRARPPPSFTLEPTDAARVAFDAAMAAMKADADRQISMLVLGHVP